MCSARLAGRGPFDCACGAASRVARFAQDDNFQLFFYLYLGEAPRRLYSVLQAMLRPLPQV